jgi:SAM-dependent methyltransferase
MERIEYLRMAEVEDGMWWYRGLHAQLVALAASSRARPLRVLDAGCGTGGLLRRLAATLPDAEVVGMDFDREACGFARAKSGRPVANGSINALPFRDGAFDLVLSADVLCHAGVDEDRALAEIGRCLAPGGALVLNLPAYDWMASVHDRQVHNARRYTRPRLALLLARNGFATERATYWNTLLFPLMVLRRKLLAPEKETSDVMLYPAPIERLFRAVMAVEAFAVSRGLDLPFGGSVLTKATKHA